MHNKLILLTVTLLIFTNLTFSQINTSSPYSRFGIGDTETLALGKSLGMGGTAIALRSPYEINIVNPASYTSLPTQSFLFQVGVRSRRVDYSTVKNSARQYDNGLTSLNAAFKIKDFWAASFGLNPLSSVGYKIKTIDTLIVDSDSSYFENNYIGEGGLTQIYIGNSFYFKGLSVGINASYIFGPILKRLESRYNDGSYNSLLRDIEHTNVGGFHFRYGMQYKPDSLLGVKNRISIGAFFENKSKISATQTQFTENVIVFNAVTLSDTLIDDLNYNGHIEMPMAMGFGISYIGNKLLLAADYSIQNWEGIEFLGEVNSAYSNNTSMSAGAEYTHDFLSKNIIKKTSFRIGGYYSTAKFKIDDTNITDMGLTCGFGIPLKNTRINFGFTAGQRGVNTIMKENYYTVNFNVNMADLWFVRRKFN